jgi:peptidoglycan hydrolase-like protein with peptidoglycan-binding domain
MRTRVGPLLVALFVGASSSGSGTFAASDDKVREYQEMLIWTGDYDGFVDGVLGDGTRQAIMGFQQRSKHPASGRITADEAALLIRNGSVKKKAAGFERVDDRVTGVSVGMPLTLVSGPTKKPWGQSWSDPSDNVDIDTFRYYGVTIQQICNRLHNYKDRNVTYFKLAGNWCIVAGTDRDGSSIYVRAVLQGSNEIGSVHEIRGFSVRLAGEAKERLKSIPIAMSSTFSLIPVGDRPPAVTAPPKDLLKTPTSELRQTSPTEAPIQRTCFNGLGDCPPSASVCFTNPEKCPAALPGNKPEQ